MRIRAKLDRTGELVEGSLIPIKGEPKIILLDKYNRQCIYSIYKDSIEFFIKGKWRNIIEGLEIYIEHIGEGTIPAGLLLYYRGKVQESKTGANRQ